MEIESSDPNQTKYVKKPDSLCCSLGRTASVAQTVEGLIGSIMFAIPTIALKRVDTEGRQDMQSV
jgi:hypothetical protein